MAAFAKLHLKDPAAAMALLEKEPLNWESLPPTWAIVHAAALAAHNRRSEAQPIIDRLSTTTLRPEEQRLLESIQRPVPDPTPTPTPDPTSADPQSPTGSVIKGTDGPLYGQLPYGSEPQGKNEGTLYRSVRTITNWKSIPTVVPSAGSRTQWIDRGPPRTTSSLATQSSRFYRVRLLAP
jgi:hypothetical protein